MAYLEEFKRQINNRDFNKIYQLWEEYCTSEAIEGEEFIEVLNLLGKSDFSEEFGKVIELGIPLWETVQDEKDSYRILKLIIDYQNVNSQSLGDLAFHTLKKYHGDHPQFEKFIKLSGLRNRLNFKYAISNFDLLKHMQKGAAVYHHKGWGTGEIMEVSFLREMLTIEFENVQGLRHISFKNSYTSLIPLDESSFLARRFINPDSLEEEAKKDPVGVITLLLEGMGPKTAAEIKDEMCELVIPEKEWSKWWQSARGKIKKNTLIHTPENVRGDFYLRKEAVSHEERLKQAISKKTDIAEVIRTTYSFVRDFPNAAKKEEMTQSIKEKLTTLLSSAAATESDKIQLYIFLESMLGQPVEGKKLEDLVMTYENIDELVTEMEIAAFQKLVLVAIRKKRSDWGELFLKLLFALEGHSLRDFIVKKLNEENKESLKQVVDKMIRSPKKDPELFFWYFQKAIKSKNSGLPYTEKEGLQKLLEALLILLHKIEGDQGQKDLIKKIYTVLTAKRFAVVRQLIEGSSEEFLREFILLTAKTHVFTNQEKKVLRSLAEVVQPSLAKGKKKHNPQLDPNIIWTTEEAYRKVHDRMTEISTKEMIEVAKEIEEARAHGDLRENSEYKFAQEKRARLQGEMRKLSSEINRARVITELDIDPEKIGIGSVIQIESSNGESLTYTLLGPWDADPDQNILSSQSQFAQKMLGCKRGDQFDFKDESFKVVDFKSIFEKS